MKKSLAMILAFVLLVGVTICFGGALSVRGGELFTFSPPFASRADAKGFFMRGCAFFLPPRLVKTPLA